MRSLILVALLAWIGATAHADVSPSTTSRHLLAGVRAFQVGHYEDAYVELRVVASAPDAPADLAFYLGPTLYKLGRYQEALVTFVTSRAAPDALTDFYLGQTYFQLKLYRKAHAQFVGLRARGLGPVFDDGAAHYIAAIDAAYQAPPSEVAVDFYLARGLELGERDPAAAEFLDEAHQVELLASARHRHAEIVLALARAWNATGRERAVVELLEPEPATDETSWQLASAYVAQGDRKHARPLLETLAHATGVHATEATALLAKLQP